MRRLYMALVAPVAAPVEVGRLVAEVAPVAADSPVVAVAPVVAVLRAVSKMLMI